MDKIPFEHINDFVVGQITRDTRLEATVGADIIFIPPNTTTEIHVHRRAENVLFVLTGSAKVVLGKNTLRLRAGDRIRIEKGTQHGFKTTRSAICFISVQSPPILNKTTGAFDLEVILPGKSRRTALEGSRKPPKRISQLLRMAR